MKRWSTNLQTRPNNSLWKGYTLVKPPPPPPPPSKRAMAFLSSEYWLLFFWDANGVLIADCLPKEITTNGTFFASLLRQLREEIGRDCAPVYKPVIAMGAKKRLCLRNH